MIGLRKTASDGLLSCHIAEQAYANIHTQQYCPLCLAFEVADPEGVAQEQAIEPIAGFESFYHAGLGIVIRWIYFKRLAKVYQCLAMITFFEQAPAEVGMCLLVFRVFAERFLYRFISIFFFVELIELARVR